MRKKEKQWLGERVCGVYVYIFVSVCVYLCVCVFVCVGIVHLSLPSDKRERERERHRPERVRTWLPVPSPPSPFPPSLTSLGGRRAATAAAARFAYCVADARRLTAAEERSMAAVKWPSRAHHWQGVDEAFYDHDEEKY